MGLSDAGVALGGKSALAPGLAGILGLGDGFDEVSIAKTLGVGSNLNVGGHVTAKGVTIDPIDDSAASTRVTNKGYVDAKDQALSGRINTLVGRVDGHDTDLADLRVLLEETKNKPSGELASEILSMGGEFLEVPAGSPLVFNGTNLPATGFATPGLQAGTNPTSTWLSSQSSRFRYVLLKANKTYKITGSAAYTTILVVRSPSAVVMAVGMAPPNGIGLALIGTEAYLPWFFQGGNGVNCTTPAGKIVGAGIAGVASLGGNGGPGGFYSYNGWPTGYSGSGGQGGNGGAIGGGGGGGGGGACWGCSGVAGGAGGPVGQGGFSGGTYSPGVFGGNGGGSGFFGGGGAGGALPTNSYYCPTCCSAVGGGSEGEAISDSIRSPASVVPSDRAQHPAVSSMGARAPCQVRVGSYRKEQ